MREIATVEFVNYFQNLGIGRRITWVGLWNKLAEESSWEMGVSLPYHVNAGDADVTLHKKDENITKIGSYKIPVKNIIDKDGDIDECCLAYELLKIVKKNKLYNKKRSDKEQTELDSLRKKRDNLSVRIYNWKQAGKDTTELVKELELLKEQIKNFK